MSNPSAGDNNRVILKGQVQCWDPAAVFALMLQPPPPDTLSLSSRQAEPGKKSFLEPVCPLVAE